jgi:hypothetical protein
MSDEIVNVWVVQVCPKCGTDEVYYEALIDINDPSIIRTSGDYQCVDCGHFDEYAEAFQITACELQSGMAFKYGPHGDWCVVKSVTFNDSSTMNIEHVDGHITARHDPNKMVFIQVDERFFTNAGHEWGTHSRDLAGVNPYYKVMHLYFHEDRALKVLKEVAS